MITKHAKRMCITASIVFLVTLALFVLASWYLYTESNRLYSRSQLVANHLAQRQAQFELTQILDATTLKREALRNYILTEVGVIDFLSNIEADATKIGVKLKTDSLKPTTGKVYDILTVQFTIVGTKTAVNTMLQALETLPYQSHINRLSITTGDGIETVTTGVVELVISLLKS